MLNLAYLNQIIKTLFEFKILKLINYHQNYRYISTEMYNPSHLNKSNYNLFLLNRFEHLK